MSLQVYGSGDRTPDARLIDGVVHKSTGPLLRHLEAAEAVAPDGYPVLWGIAWRARSASWILRHRSLLRRSLTT